MVKDSNQNCQGHRSIRSPSHAGSCPRPCSQSSQSLNWSQLFPVGIVHPIPRSSRRANRSHLRPTHGDPTFQFDPNQGPIWLFNMSRNDEASSCSCSSD